MFGYEKKRDFLFVFQAQTGALVHKFPPRYQGAKECSALVPIPGKMTQIALMEQEKGSPIYQFIIKELWTAANNIYS